MKQFIIKILTFSVLLIGTLFILKMSVPYYWGANKDFQSKVKYLNNNTKKFERIVIGSSMTLRSIKPFIVDKIDKSNVSTFNLSAAHTFHFESLYLANNFISNYDFDQVLFLVQKPTPIDDQNLHTVDSKYYLNFSNIFQILNYYKNDRKQLYNHTISFIENMLCIGEIQEIISFHLNSSSKEINNKSIKMNKKRGYYALEDELKDSNFQDKALLKRKRDLKKAAKHLVPIEKRKMNISRYGDSDQRKVYYSTISKFVEKNSENKLETVLLVMPNDPIKKVLNKNEFKLVYMGDAVDFPEYYDPKFKFDTGHLNRKGAVKFSRRLGYKLNSL